MTTCTCTGTCTCSTQGIVVNVSASGPRGPRGVQGTTGSQGASGVQGIAGASIGTTEDVPEGTTNLYFTTDRVAYTHTQGVASATWIVNHNLGFYPNLTVQDSAGTIYEGEISYTNSDSLTVTFSSAFSGKAYLS